MGDSSNLEGGQGGRWNGGGVGAVGGVGGVGGGEEEFIPSSPNHAIPAVPTTPSSSNVTSPGHGLHSPILPPSSPSSIARASNSGILQYQQHSPSSTSSPSYSTSHDAKDSLPFPILNNQQQILSGSRPLFPRIDTSTVSDSPSDFQPVGSEQQQGLSGLESSPTSPSARRNRGLSLRSQLFTKNLHNSPASAIEMTDVPITPQSQHLQPQFPSESPSHISQDSKPPPQLRTPPATQFGPHNLGKSRVKLTAKINDLIFANSDIQEEPIFPYEDSKSDKSSKFGKIRLPESNAATLLPNYYTWASKKIQHQGLRAKTNTFLTTAKNFILRIKQPPASKGGRKIPVEIVNERPLLIDERTGKPYRNNLITSSIYTPYNFFPRQLVAQFSKLANL